ncbi:Competence protein CoiA [Lactococcus lactis subsp. lactis]|nr:Competence protein CoiA [Lactococcus lactis subsp. lactis]GEB08982.1 hypothetical protein LLA03_15670 [Lactococcus lactis subsp. lactis]
MLTAIDENGQVVNLLEIEVKELTGKYFCPSCKSELFIKNGEIKMPHFAHKSLKACDLWLENESEQHLGLKKHSINGLKKLIRWKLKLIFLNLSRGQIYW